METKLQRLSDSALVEGLKNLIKQERKIVSLVLTHLEEVERRKLYAKRGYSSLFTYCTEELGYSAAAAQRRIASMRLSKQLPEIKENIQSGALNLTAVAMADSFFRHEARLGTPYEPIQKSEILKELVGKTSRQVEQTLVSISPKFVQTKERERILTPELTEIRITLTQDQMKKLTRLKELGVASGRLTNADLLDWAMDIALRTVDPLKKAERSKKRAELSQRQSELSQRQSEPSLTQFDLSKKRSAISKAQAKSSKNRTKLSEKQAKQSHERAERNFRGAEQPFKDIVQSADRAELVTKNKADEISGDLSFRKATASESKDQNRLPKRKSRRIPSPIGHEVFARDKAQCTYKDPLTGKICGSRHSVEIDHIHPWALGGSDSIENLRLLCKTHNLFRAEQTFGTWTQSSTTGT